MKASFLDAQGNRQEAVLGANIYKAAHDSKMTLDAYLAKTYKTDPEKYGSTMGQMFASAGLYMKDDPSMGIRATTVAAALDGDSDSLYKAQGSSNVADQVPASRILFPAALLTMMESKLYGSQNSDVALFDTFFAAKETVVGTRYEYPVIDYTRPSLAQSTRTSQLAEPNLMMILTTSDKQGSIPTFALGLQISLEAQRATTLDFVAMSMSRQAEIEAAGRMDQCLTDMVSGNLDNGQAALATTAIGTLDASITSPGVVTQLAWLTWLSRYRRIRQIQVCFMTLPTFIAVENRTGRPLKTEDSSAQPFNERPDIIPSLLNLSISGVSVMIVDNTVIADGTIVGIDTRYAMRKVTNSEAQYSAAEQLVMQKATNMRWDWGYVAHRLYDQAWDVLTLTVS